MPGKNPQQVPRKIAFGIAIPWSDQIEARTDKSMPNAIPRGHLRSQGNLSDDPRCRAIPPP